MRAGPAVVAMLSGCVAIAGCSFVSPAGDDVPVARPTENTSTGGQAGDSPSTPPPSVPDLPPGVTGLARFYQQDVNWADCEQIFECASVQVPLDYAKPDGQAIRLSVLRRPADVPAERRGSLLFNPGGPGVAAIPYVENASKVFDRTLLNHFDIIGLDPRGVGSSSPIDCVSDSDLDVYLASDPDPDTSKEIKANTALLRAFGEGCQQRTGALLAHVSTEDAARDMDILRALVGDKRVNYLGFSYGTFLGATYADLFPRRVGRMVLDGAIDPTSSVREAALDQAKGFQTALEAYVGDCVSSPDCPLGTDADAALARVHDLLEQLDANPLPGAGNRQLTEGLAVLGIIFPLYSKDYWPLLSSALSAALAGDGSQLLALADAYSNRGVTGYTGNAQEAILAVSCLDQPSSITVRKVRASIAMFERASPVFGEASAWVQYACSQWPVKSSATAAALHARGAAPIVVVGTTRDPATPYAEAVALAHQLQSGVLLSRNGDGHTAYRSGSPCIDAAIDSYLVDGIVPPDGKHCQTG